MLISEKIMINYMRLQVLKVGLHLKRLDEFFQNNKDILGEDKRQQLAVLCRDEKHFLDGMKVTLEQLNNADSEGISED